MLLVELSQAWLNPVMIDTQDEQVEQVEEKLDVVVQGDEGSKKRVSISLDGIVSISWLLSFDSVGSRLVIVSRLLATIYRNQS